MYLCHCYLQNNCGEKMIRKVHRKHCQRKCPRRNVRCQHCRASGTHSFMTTSHLRVCPEMMCPRNCGGVGIKRKDLQLHKQKCPLEPVQCPFYEAGCKKKLPRKDLEVHTSSSTQQHLQLVMTTSTNNHSQLISLKKEHETLRTQHHDIQQRHTRLKKEHDSLRKEHDNLKREQWDLKCQKHTCSSRKYKTHYNSPDDEEFEDRYTQYEDGW